MSGLRPEPTTDLSAAAWIIDGVGEFGSGVRGLLPAVFDAYARILHPARTRGGRQVPWATVAAKTGGRIHRLVQFDSLVGASRYGPGRDFEPDVGRMPARLLAELCEVLGEHTGTPDRCWFCVWDGWGSIAGSRSLSETIDGPRVSLPERDYILLAGPIAAATGFEDEPPSIFWPDDRAWCVATEIDLDSTYVGGSQALVRALLDDPRFEAWPAEPDDRVDAGADTINPNPNA